MGALLPKRYDLAALPRAAPARGRMIAVSATKA